MKGLLRAQYSRIVMRLAAKADIFISGDIGLLTNNTRLRVKDIGGLTSLEKTVRIRFAIGMPSTVFCSLAAVMPLTSLKIMDLIYKKSQIDCFLKYREMKEKLIKGCREIAKQTCT